MSDTPYHPFLVFSRPGEMLVVLGEDVFQRPMTELQLLNLGKQFIDTAIYMAAERKRTERAALDPKDPCPACKHRADCRRSCSYGSAWERA